MNVRQVNELIEPYQLFYDEQAKRNYYFNTQTGDSIWELPAELKERVQAYMSTLAPHSQPRFNVYKHIPKQFFRRERNKYLPFTNTGEVPARKQVESSLANNYTYKQGDEEYNFWYSKYICAKDQKEKEAALTKCSPSTDVGYTAADLFCDKQGAYFCLFFARGCCANGVNCRFYHRIPSLADCAPIDQTKDIFGRARFSTYREDMKGVGSFMKETRSLFISDYRLPNHDKGVIQFYEILLRHFCIWGELQDINILPERGFAFVKYTHRCMAEFAKQAMANQALDSNQILTVKWATEDPNPRVVENEEKDQRRMLLSALDKKKKDKERELHRKAQVQKREKHLASMMKNYRAE